MRGRGGTGVFDPIGPIGRPSGPPPAPHAAGVDVAVVIVGFDGMIALNGIGDVLQGIGTIGAGARAGDEAVPPGAGAPIHG